jgi:hypothetical protein
MEKVENELSNTMWGYYTDNHKWKTIYWGRIKPPDALCSKNKKPP